MTGLVTVGSMTVVHAHDQLLDADPDEWPGEPCSLDAPVIYSQSDIYR